MSAKLELKFDPSTIEHLGIKMYSRLPAALAELIANAFDADAKIVNIELWDSEPGNFRVRVSDDGDGMSFDEINNNFLIIGRKRRETEQGQLTKRKRKITGRKGLGKLSLFGIGKTIIIQTAKVKSQNVVEFVLDWDAIISTKDGSYNPTFVLKKCDTNFHGTSIEVSHLKRTTNFNLQDITFSLSKLFNFFDKNFKVYVSINGINKTLITKETRINGIGQQFSWDVSNIIKKVAPKFEYVDEVGGKIISSIKPLKQEIRGITLYSRGRQANEASFFGYSEAGHTFSYITGWIECDYIDDQNDDLISTDRQVIDWESPFTSKLKIVLHQVIKYVIKDWSEKRSKEKRKNIEKRTSINIDEWINNVPEKLKSTLNDVLNEIQNKPEIDDSTFDKVLKDINFLVPEYTYFHYRHLHPEIKSSSEADYKHENYYAAFWQALLRYKNMVKRSSTTNANNDVQIMTESFGIENEKPLKVSKGYKKADGSCFSEDTLKSIEEGQKYLSIGVVKGGRNVVSHEELNDLRVSGLFSEFDCLDLLSLLSHLFKRLDNANKTKQKNKIRN